MHRFKSAKLCFHTFSSNFYFTLEYFFIQTTAPLVSSLLTISRPIKFRAKRQFVNEDKNRVNYFIGKRRKGASKRSLRCEIKNLDVNDSPDNAAADAQCIPGYHIHVKHAIEREERSVSERCDAWFGQIWGQMWGQRWQQLIEKVLKRSQNNKITKSDFLFLFINLNQCLVLGVCTIMGGIWTQNYLIGRWSVRHLCLSYLPINFVLSQIHSGINKMYLLRLWKLKRFGQRDLIHVDATLRRKCVCVIMGSPLHQNDAEISKGQLNNNKWRKKFMDFMSGTDTIKFDLKQISWAKLYQCICIALICIYPGTFVSFGKVALGSADL